MDELPIGAVATRSGLAVSALRFYEQRHLSESWRPRIDARIVLLEKLRDRLDRCIGCGCLSLQTCSLANPQDRAAAFGPGAVMFADGR